MNRSHSEGKDISSEKTFPIFPLVHIFNAQSKGTQQKSTVNLLYELNDYSMKSYDNIERDTFGHVRCADAKLPFLKVYLYS